MFSYYSVTLALLAFLSTTLDDFTVVLIFFGREYVKTHNINSKATQLSFLHIIAGQVLAFTIIVAVSLGIGIGLRETISDGYIDLIGFLPILIGVYKIYEILEEDGYLEQCWRCLTCSSAKSNDEATPDPVSENQPLVPNDESANNNGTISLDRDVLARMVATTYGSAGLDEEKPWDKDSSCQTVPPPTATEPGPGAEVVEPKRISGWRNPLIEEVALYGLLFGVDNIAIYVSLICNMTDLEIAAVIVIFYSLLLFYLGIAIIIITRCPLIGNWLGDNSKYLVPAVLIGLGIYIVYYSVIWTGSA